VARAVAAGVKVLSVTDHDTVAGCAQAAAACAAAGIEFVPGVEVTSIVDGIDVHLLGYFIDIESEALHAFLITQRQARIDRLRAIVERLASHGINLDAEAILEPGIADSSRAVGRPWVARALVEAGHVKDGAEAFDRWLARGRPAFVPRAGARADNVIARIHAAGGIASLAHPLLLRHDEWIPGFVAAGLDALEAYHTKQDATVTAHYIELAKKLDLALSGGSDYHADDSHGSGGPGSISLPPEAFENLKARYLALRPYFGSGR
jgi:predicted metal-dependent phosphoesterase TrpH